jgi:hypothetical protein
VHLAAVLASRLHAALPLLALLRTCQGSCQPALPRSLSWPGSTALPFLPHAAYQSTAYNILLTICILSGRINKLGHIDFIQGYIFFSIRLHVWSRVPLSKDNRTKSYTTIRFKSENNKVQIKKPRPQTSSKITAKAT